MNNIKSRKGGYVSDYANVSTAKDYMLYIPPAADTAVSSSEGAVLVSSTPGMTKGGAGRRNAKVRGGAAVNLPNEFYYSVKGGCALCNSTMKGGNVDLTSKNTVKGGFGLEPFITALALLGARMLADKQVGLFNKKSAKTSKYSEEED